MNWMFKYFAYRPKLTVLLSFTFVCQVLFGNIPLHKNFTVKQFRDITLSKQHNNIIIAWSILPAQQHVYYEIERAEQPMKFKTVGILFPEESITVSGKFSFKDKLKGHNKNKTFYYRIKQINADGTSVYSVIKKVSYKEKKSSLTKTVANTIHKYPYCAEINPLNIKNNNKVAGILRNRFVSIQKNIIAMYQYA